MTSSQTERLMDELEDRWIGRETDKWLDILTDGWRDSKTDRWRDCRQMDGETERQTDGWRNRKTDGERERPTNGKTEGQMDGVTERQSVFQCSGCVQVEEHHAADIDVYHCPNCHPIHGPSLMKKRNNWHRHDYTEEDDGRRPVQAGTAVFIQQLQARSFPSAEEIVVRMQGSHVTRHYLETEGFYYPIIVQDKEGLGLRLPPASFSVRDVQHYVGGDKVIDVIDVARQADSKMKLREFVKYYYQPERPKVLNLISLEFSDTRMAELVKVPDIAREMSWVEKYWPDDSIFPKPFVQKYCLMGVKNSYTDFHIDFGGTSVWYHVLWGEKIFYLIEPTETNLALYESWSSSANQSEVFFGEKVEKCYKCVVKQGTTVLLPTGWIHAVLTSQDCMAFGGNFLHNLNIGMQLMCYEMERRLKTPDLFKFPYFEAISWYVAKNLLKTLRELREEKRQPQEYLVEGVKALISALKTWLRRELMATNSEIPDHIRPSLLIKDLSREIRHLEVQEEDPSKSQGNLDSTSARSSLERRHHAQRVARRLRPHHHHHHHHHLQHQHQHQHEPRLRSNLDILELHTREVLKRLEVGPLEEDSDMSSKVNRKFKKVVQPSAVPVDGNHDNALRLVLCNGRIVCERLRLGNIALKAEKDETSPCQQHHVRPEKPSSCQQEKVKVEAGQITRHELRIKLTNLSGLKKEEEDEDEEEEEKDSSESGSSEDEEECEIPKMRNSGSQHHKPLKREHPSSPSRVSEGGAVTQETWCSSSKSAVEECFYTDRSLSPALHPSKRHTHNSSPISNQATKGKRPKKGNATSKQRLSKLMKMSTHTRLLL
ncbi:lysine-specific demethylase 7A isoform X2 [Hemibagrus wyckioides]|uniref:lysine-specific demethylase 7A isoform X2 n=1 Tax=Hemibagrus wyckioides TaxID=337641 RepID=UPI00266C7AC4|nr:lysine-specific demethylase 7A isoform X2 [Hemibagrus wyckioides]